MLLNDKAVDYLTKGFIFASGVYAGKKLFGDDSHTSSSETRYIEVPRKKKKNKKKKKK